MTSPPRFKDALEVFARHRVDLIVVGGVAAVIGGAPLATFDLDVVHARYRDPAGRLLRPDASGLAGTGRHLLQTRCGPVDILGAIGRGRTYEDLLSGSAAIDLDGLTIRVLEPHMTGCEPCITLA